MATSFTDAQVLHALIAADIAFTEFNTKRALRAKDGRIERHAFGDVVALRDHTVEYPYYNRAVGLDETRLSILPKVIEFYHEADRACHLTLLQPLASPRVLDRLAEHGFVLKGLDCIFAVRCDTRERHAPTFSVRRARREDLETVFDLWQAPFPTPISPEVRKNKADAQLSPEFPIYLAFDGDRPIAMATMFLHGPIAWLGNANTFVEERCKGAHLALLLHRLEEATRMGCSWAITDTDFGTPSHRNVLRAGLSFQFVALDMLLPLPSKSAS